MAILIGCERLGHEWPGKRVLKNQTFSVFEGDRIGIVGLNGDGKSTLIRLLAGTLEPDEGTITYRNNIHVGVLGQADELADDDTVKHAIVGDVPDYVWAADVRTREIMERLAADLDWDSAVGTLSGGQRRRCDLARLLVSDFDVVCLDEPTNHLDLSTIRWLADHLKRRWVEGTGALLVVTHDRWFLDEVATNMWEVHDGRIEPFEGGYSAYVQQRVERDRRLQVAETKRQNMLRKELNWLAHGAKARTSKPKFRIDAAMALVENDPPLRNRVELERMALTRLGKQVIETRGVSVSFGTETGEHEVLHDITWIIGPGDRVGILGENGAGKSTLLKVLCRELRPTKGWVKVGKTVRFGILSQRLERLSTFDDWRMQELFGRFKRTYVVDGKETSPERLAERLGFGRAELMSYVGDLSGGQRRRLAILCVLMEEPNVLVLDEPGNDLDTDMLTVVEDLLDTWPGTLIMVSHDRNLLERVTDDQYALIGGTLTHCPGGVDEYLSRLEAARSTKATSTREKTKDAARKTAGGLTNAERRDLKRRFEAVGRKMSKAEAEVEAKREALEATDVTDFVALTEAQQALDSARALMDELETEWLELSERLED